VREQLPPERLEIVIEAVDAEAGGAGTRRITFRPLGDDAAAWVAALRRAWEEAGGRDAGAGS